MKNEENSSAFGAALAALVISHDRSCDFKGYFAVNPNGIYQYASVHSYRFNCGYDWLSDKWFAYSDQETTRFTEQSKNLLGQTLDKLSDYYAEQYSRKQALANKRESTMKSTLTLSHDYADAVALAVFKFPENYKQDISTATDAFCQTLLDINFVSTLQVAYIRLRMRTVLLNIPVTCLETDQALATLDQAYRSRYLELCNGDRSRFTGQHANWFSFLSKADRLLLICK